MIYYNNLYFNNGLVEEDETKKTDLIKDIAGNNIYLQKAIIEEIAFIKSLNRRGVEKVDEYRKQYKSKTERKMIVRIWQSNQHSFVLTVKRTQHTGILHHHH